MVEKFENMNMRDVILENWKNKISYPFNHKDLEELEKIIDYYEGENQELKKQLERSEKARKDVYDYINFLVIIDTQLAGGRFKDTIWGKELLEILDIDKGE